MTEKLYVIGKFKAKANQVAKIIELLEQLTFKSKNESGCIDYGFYRSTDDPHTFISFEIWSDIESETLHWDTEHVQEALRQVPELIDGELEVARYTKVI